MQDLNASDYMEGAAKRAVDAAIGDAKTQRVGGTTPETTPATPTGTPATPIPVGQTPATEMGPSTPLPSQG